MNFINEIDFIKDHKLLTPVMFYDQTLAKSPVSLIKKHLKECDIYFALKSCYNIPMLRFFASQGFGAEIMSEFEYKLAKSAKFDRIIVNGLGRSEAFIKKILQDDNITLIIDTDRDLNIVKDYLSTHPKKNCSLGIRVRFHSSNKKNLNHLYCDPLNKLGNYEDSNVYLHFLSFIEHEKRAKWDIIHTHFTINELKADVYLDMLKKIKKHLAHIEKKRHISPLRVDVGGGFEVYTKENEKKLKQLFDKLSTMHQKIFPYKKLVVEPGRFLSAYAGYVIGKVIDIKQVENKFWLVTDIGTNVLIPNQNARYLLLYPPKKEDGLFVGITDGITSGANNIVESTYLNAVCKIGDYIVIGNIGAYTDVFSAFWGYAPFVVCNKDKDKYITVTRSPKDIKRLENTFFNLK